MNIRFEKNADPDTIEVVVYASERDEEVSALIERLSGKQSETLAAVGSDGAMLRIPTDKIVLVSVNGKTVRIITEADCYTLRTALQSLEEKLEKHRFVRISRYEIVNLDKVLKFDFTLGGTLRLELAGGMETWASRRNIPMIRKKLTEGV